LLGNAFELLTRTGLDWIHKYPAIADACALTAPILQHCPGGVGFGQCRCPRFLLVRSSASRREDPRRAPLIERKGRLASLLLDARSPLHYCNHHIGGGGREFHEKACAVGLEGIVSKRADAAYAPGNRGLWVKVKCMNREEFVVVGWTDPEGSRLGSARFCSRLTTPTGGWFMPAAPGLASTIRSWNGSGAASSRLPRPRCRWTCRHRARGGLAPRSSSAACIGVRLELVAEVKYLTWTDDDNLLRQVVYERLRGDKPPAEVRRPSMTT